ncbi:MAG: SGNH/GDSL hydrolase family protein [Marinilabiliaceae bacterium]|nr:SGNH/GDSL hydrolase family protein [Marinilabiliaceae bacterium]
MKNIRLGILLAITTILGCVNVFGQTVFEDEQSVVFLGNSITHRCQYSQYIEDFYLTRYPEKKIKYHTAGVAGDKVGDALFRFNSEVARYHPDVVTILLGMNDASYLTFDREAFETYKKGMNALLDSIKQVGATPVIMSPTMFDSKQAIKQPWNSGKEQMCEEYNGVLALYGAWLQEVALKYEYPYINLWSDLNAFTYEKRKKDQDFTIISDGVHPDMPGMAIMATSFLMQTHGPDTVSVIDMDLWKGKAEAIKVQGGKLIDVKSDRKKLEFSFAPESLPWVLPEKLQQKIADYPQFVDVNRELLKITGLPTGDYLLTINCDSIATYSSHQLAAGVELQNNPLTPQYRQALKIAQMNANRNGILYSLRDMWMYRKNLANAQKALLKKPDDEECKKKIRDLESRLADFDEKEKNILAQSDAIMKQIYECNMPEVLEYKLVTLK